MIIRSTCTLFWQHHWNNKCIYVIVIISYLWVFFSNKILCFRKQAQTIGGLILLQSLLQSFPFPSSYIFLCLFLCPSFAFSILSLFSRSWLFLHFSSFLVISYVIFYNYPPPCSLLQLCFPLTFLLATPAVNLTPLPCLAGVSQKKTFL